MASAFSICAIVDSWRTTITSSSTEAEGPRPADPAWISSINAISLAIAIAANLFLLALMTRRLPFNLAMPATIVGWLVAASLLIGIVAAAPADAKLPAGQQRTFTQGYYYAILAAALYILMSILLFATACGVWLGKFDRHFKLTLAQRTLMFQVIIFLGYILCAAAVYARVESWDYLDAVYWTTVTALTIGYGDYSPKTHLGRGLLFPMAVGAILFVGLIIASIRSLVLERTSTKVVTRMFERARQKALKNMNMETGEVKLGPFSRRQVKHKESASSELKRREQEFNIMRSVQQRARFVDRLVALSVSLFAFAFLWFIGAVVFWQSESNSTGGEDWSYFQSLYFTYVSLLTIGYGDFYPQENSSKPVFVLWAWIALPTLTVLIGATGDAISEGVATFTLWLSNHLPENVGFLRHLKHSSAKAKKGDGSFDQAKPPGFMSDSNNDSSEMGSSAEAAAVQGLSGGLQDPEKAADQTPEQRQKQQDHAERYRPLLLLNEIRNVSDHMDASPPRKYTYAEWTWFLKLIGQDETTEEGHRRPTDVTKALRDDTNAGAEDGSWSWLGQQSPLVAATDEPKWVLKKLMDALQKELKGVGEGKDPAEVKGVRDE